MSGCFALLPNPAVCASHFPLATLDMFDKSGNENRFHVRHRQFSPFLAVAEEQNGARQRRPAETGHVTVVTERKKHQREFFFSFFFRFCRFNPTGFLLGSAQRPPKLVKFITKSPFLGLFILPLHTCTVANEAFCITQPARLPRTDSYEAIKPFSAGGVIGDPPSECHLAIPG